MTNAGVAGITGDIQDIGTAVPEFTEIIYDIEMGEKCISQLAAPTCKTNRDIVKDFLS